MPPSPIPSAPLSYRPWLDQVLVVMLSGAVFLGAHHQAFTASYVINDDVRQHLFWMQQWLDPELFQNDLLADYSRAYVSWGVRGLYWLASGIVAPLTFSKVLPGFLFVFLALCLYLMGRELQGRGLAWTAAGVFWLMPFFLANLAGGLARAFAAPLLAWFWLGWLTGRPWIMGLALLLQALVIPYVFPVAVLASCLAWGGARFGLGLPPPFPARALHLGVLFLGTALVLAFNYQLSLLGYGPLVSPAEMAGRPEFLSQGRYQLVPLPSFFWELVGPWEYLAPFREAGPVAGGVICGAVVLAVLLGARRLQWTLLKPRLHSFWALGLASLSLYGAARLAGFRLFMPDRYLIFWLNLSYCLALALCLKEAALWLKNRWLAPTAAVPARAPHFWMAALLVLSAASLGTLRLKDTGLYDYGAYGKLYAALSQTPKDALLAGHPNLMDNVITFAHRKALATYELSHPWSRGYWEQVRPRLEDFFRAYYSADPQELVDFARRYGVDFLVVDDRHFTPEFLQGGPFLVPLERPYRPGQPKGLAERVLCPFFAPFDAQIRRLTKDHRGFAALAAGVFPSQVIDEHLRILDLRPWLSPRP